MAADQRMKVGVLGGGQLGRMMGYPAAKMGVELVCLDPAGDAAPAARVADVVQGSFNDKQTVLDFVASVFPQSYPGKKVLTVEIEHVSIEALETVEAERLDIQVVPSAKCLASIRDKYEQKQIFSEKNVAVVESQKICSADDIKDVARKWKYPVMLKTRFFGYDGKGNFVVNSDTEAEIGFKELGEKDLYVERWSPFVAEIAVMVARSVTNDTRMFPLVETVQKNNICDIVYAPPSFQVSEGAKRAALSIAQQAVEAVEGFGIFGVELFLMNDDTVLVNEIAPRPHNSGHYTIDACLCDQFEQHLRAVLGLPLRDGTLVVPHTAMVNILGGPELDATRTRARQIPGVFLHDYGKAVNKPGRKMGHANIVASSCAELEERVARLRGNPEDGTTGLPNATRPAAVGIIMGSDSDLPTMRASADILKEFGVGFELTVVSAHRTPDRLFEYSKTAISRGLKVIIAGAGGAAHLPGMVAALTTLPVVGVPVKSSALSGNDSLLSIVQMPGGIPVATVAIGNAKNAGLLAVRMLAIGDSNLQQKLDHFHHDQEQQVLAKAEKLERLGYEAYLDEK
eukprot:m.341916 g.341916  ORF g.341916 m.341916 type:complete len:569 (-) comp20618_c0_seq1:921-2627(-)